VKIAWEGIIPRWKNDGRELFLGGKRREGIIPRWKNHGRELFLGVKNNWREKFREGKIPYPNIDVTNDQLTLD